ncbi:MAG: outer membrane beta-barrel protein [Bacteroidaceae bacterium]|nr:outer membrane beta-barrel protein [Bacteroidaceae bacterium]
MKRLVLHIIIYTCFCLSLSARDLTFRGESLAYALATLRDMQTEYNINFIANDLETLPVHADLAGLSVPKAVKLICSGLPVKAKIRGKEIFIQYDKRYKPRTIKLSGVVCDARTREYLMDAKVELLSEDSTLIDSVRARQSAFYYDGSGRQVDYDAPRYNIEVPALSRHYIFRISMDDYRTVCYDYVLERVGRRETSRNMSPFYLHKVSKTLQEVTVKASRVRFYHKGDTIVYDASLFQLAEGSMLDALIRQLPGVELKSDGRIYHNGKFVDDLLLNGKDLFQGNSKLMLENLPAYTVKDVAVYDKQTEENEWLGRTDESSQHHVIDVRLKREYTVGWIANIEAGAGLRQDETPYLARLFAMRSDERSNIRVYAKANNLNDEGSFDMVWSDGWRPDRSGKLTRNELVRVDANLTSDDKKRDYYAYVEAHHAKEWQDTRTTTQTFLPDGDTYDYGFAGMKNEEWDVSLWNRFIHNGKQLRTQATADARYRYFRNASGSTSALFSAPVEVSHQLLDDLFSPTSPRPNLRDTLINRQLRESKGTGHDIETTASLYETLKIKGSGDYMNFGINGSYKENARQEFSRQNVNSLPSSPLGGDRGGLLFRHQFVDAPPRSKFEVNSFVQYTFSLGEHYRQLLLGYSFNHSNRREQESIYRLDRLVNADSSFSKPIGLLPSVTEYRQVFDRTNSHLAHYIDNTNAFWADFKYGLGQKEWGEFYLDFRIDAMLNAQRHDYERGAIDTLLHRFAPMFEFKTKPWLRTKDGHHAGLEVRVRSEAPDLLNEAGIVDDTDPMNIRIGNPDLRYAIRTDAVIDGNLYSMNKRMHNRIDLSYGLTHNAIGIGQIYDRTTGRRTFIPANVNGNWDATAKHTINYSFGDGKKHDASMVTQFSYRNSVDLMGDNGQQTTDNGQLLINKSVVRSAALSFSPRLNLSLGKHTLGFSSDIAWNRYTSDRTTFQDINAWQYRIGMNAIVHLPWKFDLTTDLTLYGRTGYADASLNTADVVWNARLARALFKGKWVVMLDGFDILGQLSNVTRTINAQGRTETYTNVLPRYGLLHFIYKFQKNPKQKQ